MLWPFYLEAFIGTALYISIPFIALYLNSIGLSFTQIGIIMGAWPLASLLFEIPTGAIADLWGRKASVILGWTLQAIVLISIPFTTKYLTLLILFFLFGLTQTFVSGSYDAWIVDLLNEKKMHKFVKNYFAKRTSMINAGLMLAGIIGAFFVDIYGLKIIWIISSFAMFLSVFFLIFGEEIYERKKFILSKSIKSIKEQTKKSISYGYSHPILFYLFIITFIFAIFNTFTGLFVWTSLFKMKGLSDKGFGYLWAASNFIGIIAPLIASKLTNHKREKKSLTYLALATFISGITIIFLNNLLSIITLFLLIYLFADAITPIWNTYFHRFIPGKIRATMGSLQGMILSIAGIISFPIAGYLIDSLGSKYTLFISGLLMIPILILYSKIKEK